MKLFDSAIMVFEDEFDRRIGNETLVITGSPRGGTSVIAYAFRSVGYALGQRFNPHNHEDLDVRSGINKFRETPETLRELVASRNQAHIRWGFKMPRVGLMLAQLAPELRNPAALVVYRNPLEIGRSIVTHDQKWDTTTGDFLDAVVTGSDRLGRITAQILKGSVPSLLINYEKLMADPSASLNTIFGALKLDVETSKLEKLVTDLGVPGYKRLEERA